MYKHLLVPTDGTELSTNTVTQAIDFARGIGATITFFYAAPDHTASLTNDAALLELIAPNEYQDDFSGRARAILSKAEVSARSQGVQCLSVSRTSNRPHEAILAIASERGCDLIFMASHGPRSLGGLMLGSETLKVLVGSPIPVLVSSVAKNDPTPAMSKALSIMKDEHRSIAVVVNGLQFLMRELRKGAQPDFRLLRAMLYYIEAFPETLHHPKEEAYLFRKLQQRTDEFAPLLEKLRNQHAEGARRLEVLKDSLVRYEAGPEIGLDAFATAVEEFASDQLRHLATEETTVIPAAKAHLRQEDWVEIAAAFGKNGDPRFGAEPDENFRVMFSRIANLRISGVTHE